MFMPNDMRRTVYATVKSAVRTPAESAVMLFERTAASLSPETFAAPAEALIVPSQACKVVRMARRGSSTPGPAHAGGQSILSFPGVHRNFLLGQVPAVSFGDSNLRPPAVSFPGELV